MSTTNWIFYDILFPICFCRHSSNNGTRQTWRKYGSYRYFKRTDIKRATGSSAQPLSFIISYTLSKFSVNTTVAVTSLRIEIIICFNDLLLISIGTHQFVCLLTCWMYGCQKKTLGSGECVWSHSIEGDFMQMA